MGADSFSPMFGLGGFAKVGAGGIVGFAAGAGTVGIGGAGAGDGFELGLS